MTYKDEVYAILNDDPDADPAEMAAEVGCAESTARHYRSIWSRHHGKEWAYQPAAETTDCENCPHVALCQFLSELQGPTLCEAVPNIEKVIMENHEIMKLYENARAGARENE